MICDWYYVTHVSLEVGDACRGPWRRSRRGGGLGRINTLHTRTFPTVKYTQTHTHALVFLPREKKLFPTNKTFIEGWSFIGVWGMNMIWGCCEKAWNADWKIVSWVHLISLNLRCRYMKCMTHIVSTC